MKGNHPQVIAIIPARYASTRLPGKPLLDLAGKPIIQHVYERTAQAKIIDQVFVATDDDRIAAAVAAFGGQAIMTSAQHETGTDRIAEVARGLKADIIVNVQGDEPMIDPVSIERAVEPLCQDSALMMGTLCEPLASVEDLFNANVVKVVMDDDGNALYFSRAPLPYPRIAGAGLSQQELIEQLRARPQLLKLYWKHIGLYVYRREFLLQFTAWPRAWLEEAESLEQLRALARGYRIRVAKIAPGALGAVGSIGIDTPEDLARARRAFDDRSV